MSVRFIAVETDEDRERLAKLADEIWHEYWPAIIGDAQTDYMVEKFQSLEAIKRDMAEHAYEYWFVVDESGKTDMLRQLFFLFCRQNYPLLMCELLASVRKSLSF